MSGKDILKKLQSADIIYTVPGMSARHIDNVCTPAACLGSERGKMSAPGRYFQNACKCLLKVTYSTSLTTGISTYYA
jgi:hypothetical protein